MATSNTSETKMMIPNLTLPALLVDGPEAGRDGGHHVGEDQDRHALADAALGDQLGEPHDERGAGGEDSTMNSGKGQLKLGIRSMLVPSRAESWPWKA